MEKKNIARNFIVLERAEKKRNIQKQNETLWPQGKIEMIATHECDRAQYPSENFDINTSKRQTRCALLRSL